MELGEEEKEESVAAKIIAIICKRSLARWLRLHLCILRLHIHGRNWVRKKEADGDLNTKDHSREPWHWYNF